MMPSWYKREVERIRKIDPRIRLPRCSGCENGLRLSKNGVHYDAVYTPAGKQEFPIMVCQKERYQ